MTILLKLLPYLTLCIGYALGFFSTRGNLKNTFLTIEIKHKEAETKKVLLETAQAIVKTEERGGAVKIRSQEEQEREADTERLRVKELFSNNG